MSHPTLKALLGAAAALSLTGSAFAATADASQRVVVIVKASDTDLHTPMGAKALALRIRNAAAQACGRDDFPIAVRFSDGFIHCREAAIDRAIQDVGSPLLADALGRPPQVLAHNTH
jgi:UrcA family protein